MTSTPKPFHTATFCSRCNILSILWLPKICTIWQSNEESKGKHRMERREKQKSEGKKENVWPAIEQRSDPTQRVIHTYGCMKIRSRTMYEYRPCRIAKRRISHMIERPILSQQHKPSHPSFGTLFPNLSAVASICKYWLQGHTHTHTDVPLGVSSDLSVSLLD